VSHDWGVKVAADLPTETLIEIRDGLKSGRIALEFVKYLTPDVPGQQTASWIREITSQMIMAYDTELARRRS